MEQAFAEVGCLVKATLLNFRDKQHTKVRILNWSSSNMSEALKQTVYTVKISTAGSGVQFWVILIGSAGK